MIIAIDGPAASGKSSTARALARRLAFRHLESGAFYRALTLAALRNGVPPDHWEELSGDELDGFAVSARPTDEGFALQIDGRDVGDAIRSADVNAHVSRMAAVPHVRHWLLDRLRAAADGVDTVTDGRDMGTVVFPNADLKVFLVAGPETRARRRLAENGVDDPTPDELRAETRRLLDRDRLDSQRATAPLRKADDAITVDTTALTFDEQVEMIEAVALSRRSVALP